MRSKIKIRINPLVLFALIMALSGSCKKNDPKPEHYTVCVTCVLLNTGDTIPDHCTRDDFVASYIKRMEEAQNPVTGTPLPYKCWPR
jgi:hypothetical protein